MKAMQLIGLMFSRRWLVTTLIVLAVCAGFIRLGFWQLSRLQQRLAFNAHFSATRALPPLNLNSASAVDWSAMEYRNAVVTGSYDFENQIALRNQYNNRNQYGYALFTPLILDDGSAVLVERGWIPADGNSAPADWRQYDRPGKVTLSGVLRLGRAAPEVGGIPNPTLTPGQTQLEFWYLIDLDRIAKQLSYPLLPAYLQLDPDPASDQPPIPYPLAVDTSNGPHLGYAIQWFAFSAILFFGYPLYYLRRQK